MEQTEPQPDPRELRVAIILLWIAFAAGLIGAAIDLVREPTGIIGVVITAAFALFTAAVTYYFSLARNWARVATLVLFIMNLVGAYLLPSLFERSALAGCLYVGELVLQAIVLYLAFATPASKVFRRHAGDDSAAMRAILPVGRSGWAIAAGYLALFSVLLLPAPFALVTGILAIRDIRRHPEMHGMGRAIFGVVMGSAGVLVLLALFAFRMTR